MLKSIYFTAWYDVLKEDLINISLKKSQAIETVVTLRGRYVAHQQEDDCSDPFGQ